MLGAWPVSRSWNPADRHRDDAAVACSTVSRRRPAAGDTALLIYTSGTTGLPKAAIVTHGRLVEWSCWFAAVMDVTAGRPPVRLPADVPQHRGCRRYRCDACQRRFSDDRAPLFGQPILGRCGGWRLHDCPVHWRTVPLPGAQSGRIRAKLQHRLRLACGNGLRADIWQQFQQRFGIPHLSEFYAATEGNVSLYNWEEKPGAVGRVPQFLAHRFPVALIRCNLETGEAHRGADGFCIRCAPDEIGEAIGQIAGPDARTPAISTATRTSKPPQAKCCTTSLCRGIAGFARAT